MKYILTLLLAVASVFAMAQQHQLDLAEHYCKKHDYLRAEPHLLKAYDQKATFETALLIARNYTNLHLPAKSSEWYKRASAYQDIPSSDKLNYAIDLTRIGAYTRAIYWFNTFLDENPGHDVATNYLNQLIEIEELFRDSAQFKIKETVLNTEYNEYAPFANANGIYYISEGTHGFFHHKVFIETHEAYDDLYFYNFETQKAEKVRGKINSPFHEGAFAITDDKNTIYFTRNKYHKHKLEKDDNHEVHFEIFECHKDKHGKWSEINKLNFDKPFISTGHPSLNKAGDLMFFAGIESEDQVHSDLYISEKVDGKWTKTRRVNGMLNTSNTEAFPCYLESRNMLFFSSDGLGGFGGLDIYLAHLNSDFEVTRIKNIGTPMNSSEDDFSMSFSGNFTGYFATKRNGTDDILAFEYSPKNIEVTGQVVDAITKEPLSNVEISVQRDSIEMSYRLTDKDGRFQIFLDSNEVYSLYYKKEHYQSSVDTLVFAQNTNQTHEVYKELQPSIHQLMVEVINKKNRTPYKGSDVMVTVHNLDSGYVDTLWLNNIGQASIELLHDSDYEIKAEKEGLFIESYTMSTKGKEESSESITFELEEITVNKAIVLNHIYYDFDRHHIRDDSKPELDKLANLLLANPLLTVEISSHTDNRGSHGYNDVLSQRRSESTVDYLIKKGVAPERLIAKGYGETMPINHCNNNMCNEDDHQLNRRTEFKVIEVGT